nr:hypothetical protein Iba_chr05aCG1550 [Ipomoea batatas]
MNSIITGLDPHLGLVGLGLAVFGGGLDGEEVLLSGHHLLLRLDHLREHQPLRIVLRIHLHIQPLVELHYGFPPQILNLGIALHFESGEEDEGGRAATPRRRTDQKTKISILCGGGGRCKVEHLMNSIITGLDPHLGLVRLGLAVFGGGLDGEEVLLSGHHLLLRLDHLREHQPLRIVLRIHLHIQPLVELHYGFPPQILNLRIGLHVTHLCSPP